MNQPVIFVGGIHGAGKSTLCRLLAPLLGLEHVTASSLIRDALRGIEVVTEEAGGKAVSDAGANQERLLRGLRAYRIPSEGSNKRHGLLLDGHFCLHDTLGRVVEISSDVFKEINPAAVLLIEATVDTIFRRLKDRDGCATSLEALDLLATCERIHAAAVCADLGIPLYNAVGDVEPKVEAEYAASKLRHHLEG